MLTLYLRLPGCLLHWIYWWVLFPYTPIPFLCYILVLHTIFVYPNSSFIFLYVPQHNQGTTNHPNRFVQQTKNTLFAVCFIHLLLGRLAGTCVSWQLDYVGLWTEEMPVLSWHFGGLNVFRKKDCRTNRLGPSVRKIGTSLMGKQREGELSCPMLWLADCSWLLILFQAIEYFIWISFYCFSHSVCYLNKFEQADKTWSMANWMYMYVGMSCMLASNEYMICVYFRDLGDECHHGQE